MVLYVTTRRSYSLEHELTVDYGTSYARHYFSGSHLPTVRPLYTIPPETIDVSAPASWPNLQGWFNPKRQPMRRPAFEEILPHCHGSEPRICVLPDEPELVATCKAALERESTEANEAAVSALARGRRRASGTSLSAPLLKRMKASASELTMRV
jgi:hypothetical protein